MKGKRLRMRAARLLAVMYVMYVVMSGMAIPGVDGSYKPLIRTKAVSDYYVTIGNSDALKQIVSGEVTGCIVTASPIAQGKRTTSFTIDSRYSTNVNDGKFNIYSVKYGGVEYYYDSSKTNNGTTTGLFYSDGKWQFVFPEVPTGNVTVEVQLTLNLYPVNGNDSINLYKTGHSSTAGNYESLSKELVDSKLDKSLGMQYYAYDGSLKTASYSAGINTATGSNFGYSNIRFYCSAKEDSRYVYDIRYGEDSFRRTLNIWTTDEPKATAYIEPGTNRLVVDTNIENAKKYIQITEYVSTLTELLQGTYAVNLTYKNVNVGGVCEIPEEGIYLPLTEDLWGDTLYYLSARISVVDAQAEKGFDIPLAVYQSGFGPATSKLGSIEAGDSKNITEGLKNIQENSSAYAGNVIKVGNQEVTIDKPYSDDYVTIDYYGNVTAKKASGGSKTYELTTKNQYTKMMKSGNYIGYVDASGNYSTTAAGKYGYQEWPVTLTVTTTGSSSTTETTEAPTTAAPTTYKATLSTSNTQTTIESGSKVATGNNGSITLEAGQTVTVTPGTSTYGSTVTVSDNATNVTKNSNGTYTFTMPAKNVTVTVTDIILSSISATIKGTGLSASSPYAFGTKASAPTNTELVNALKSSQSNLSITAKLSDESTTSVTSSQASYAVKSNTLGTATGTDTITYPGTAEITISYGGKPTTVTYYYTYTTTNQKTLQSISIKPKTSSTLSTDSNKPTTYDDKSALPTKETITNQIEITATYKDSLGNTTTGTIENAKAVLQVNSDDNVTSQGGVYAHTYTSQVTATYDGKTSNMVTFYYQYKNYSITCNTVDEAGGSNIPSNLKATVSPTSDIEKGTKVTITTGEDTTLKYLKTKISIIGMTSKTDYSDTVSGNTFTMPDESVTVTVTYTKLSGYTVTPPTKTKLEAMPTKEKLNTLLSGASLTPEYKSMKGTKVDLTNELVTTTLGADTETFKDGVTTHTIPVTVEFNGITKENAFSFTYEEKHSYTASVEQAEGPVVQLKKAGAYTNSISGYYGDTITVRVPEETQQYAFPTVTVKSASGKIIKTMNQPGETIFTMPAENVTVTAVYQKLTDLIVTPPDTSKGEYNQNTKEKDLPLGTIVAEYGSANQTKEINMTSSMYKIGEREENTTTDSEGNKTITATVDVTIHVEYGGITKDVPFSYSYSYTVSKDSKAITIKEVSCEGEALDNSGLVKVSQNIADPNSEIIITVKEIPEYAFPSVTVKTASETTISSTLSDTEDEKTATFTMPNEDVEIVVDYKPLTKLTLQEPDKKEYDYYTKPEDLDLTGGSLTAAYGTSGTDVKTIALKTEAGVSNGCTISCTEGTATGENGVRVIPVTVSITYGKMTVSYQYTYQEVRGYRVTLDDSTLPEDLVNRDKIRLSTTSGNYNDELTLSLPADTGDMYAFPAVTITRGSEVETWEPEDGVYKTVITDDMTVSVSYCKLGKLELTLPTGNGFVGSSLNPIEALDTSKVKLKLVYYNDKEEEGGRIPVPTSGNASFAYGEETESVTDGVCIHTVPVLVTANYKDLVEAEDEYSVWYRNYQVSAKDVDGNSLSVDKNRATAGDTITIFLTSGMDVQRITANNNFVGYELSEDGTKAEIVLSEEMRSDKTGYTFVVAYQTIQKVAAPTEAVVVSDRIMTEEELSQALADLGSFDFGTAFIKVSYNELEPNTEILLNSPSITKKLLQDKTTEKESADGTYIERTYIIQATVNGKSVEVPITVKVQKKADTSGDASGTGTKQQNPNGDAGNANTTGSTSEQDNEPAVTSTKPGKVSGAKVASKKRKLTVTWKAADNATAYEIWVSTKKNGGYLKAATVKKSGSKKTYSYTIKELDGSKLKKGKTYYVKVGAVNVKSKLAKKTITQTAKSKRNRRLYVTVKSVKNAVSYTVKASTKKKSGYKTIFKFDEIGKKKYTKYIKHQKRNTKYYIKVEVKVETGKRQEGAYSSVVKIKCK